MQRKRFTIATRKSPLALWQANFIRDSLISFWPNLGVDLLPMTTSGDRFLKDKLLVVGGKGMFVKELEEALLNNTADLAVHSMKDVPAFLPCGLSLGAICQRHSPFDALVSDKYTHFNNLPPNAVVGTVSLRRQSQLLALRPDLVIRPLRGNIHTRMSKMKAGEYDAIILAAAGLERMGLADKISYLFSPEEMLPSCGQGALGIECRADDLELQELLAPVRDEITTVCVNAERLVSELLGGNCHTPLSVFCQLQEKNILLLRVKITSADGKKMLMNEQSGLVSDAMFLAEIAVKKLLDDGAQEILMMADES